MQKLRTYYAYGYIARAIKARYGENAHIKLNSILSAELLSEHLQSLEKIQLHLSDRVALAKPVVYEPLYTTLFYIQMVAYVDAQRICGLQIKQAVENYLIYQNVSEDELAYKTALKVYDRYRLDKQP